MLPVCCFKFTVLQSKTGYDTLARIFKTETDLPMGNRCKSSAWKMWQSLTKRSTEIMDGFSLHFEPFAIVNKLLLSLPASSTLCFYPLEQNLETALINRRGEKNIALGLRLLLVGFVCFVRFRFGFFSTLFTPRNSLADEHNTKYTRRQARQEQGLNKLWETINTDIYLNSSQKTFPPVKAFACSKVESGLLESRADTHVSSTISRAG